jgi:two-component system, chemotaxis family, protein-glutamate methylesterase/glutaminase
VTKVLVVDDSALMRRLLTGVLTEAGFQVEAARNGAGGRGS